MNLSFQFDSLAAFYVMAGHGPYVWAAYAITLVGIAGLILQARQKRKRVVMHIRSIARRQHQFDKG